MIKKIKAAYLGSGPISHFHIPALKKANFKIISVFSRKNSSRLKEFAFKFSLPKPSYDLLSFINDSKEADCFVVAIKTEFTPKILKILMKLNKPIFVEKPGALKSKDLINLKKIKNNKVFFAYNRRFYNAAEQAFNFIQKNTSTNTIVKIPDSTRTWHQFKINGCHVIDLLFFLYGKLKLLNVYPTKNIKKTGVSFVMRSRRGDVISVLLNWGSPDNFEISINGDKKKFELKPIEIGSYYEKMEIIEPSKKIPLRLYKPKVKYVYAPKKNFNIKPGFLEQYKEFYNYLIKKQKSKKLCGLNEAIRDLEIIEKIIKASKK